jgi:hypothetical protein
MCLFTHFAAGALAGGLTGQVGWAVLAGLASHVVLDTLPHYDFPDWRVEIAGGAAALVLLGLLPFASTAAVVGGLAGMLPDLENLLQKLGKLERRHFVFPSHTGFVPHGRECSPRNLVWQSLLAVACFTLLGLVAPSGARAAAPVASEEARMGRPQALLRGGDPTRTRVEVLFPMDAAPRDWDALPLDHVHWYSTVTRPAADAGARAEPAPQIFGIALPTTAGGTWRVESLAWWRAPAAATEPEDLVETGPPAVFRDVPVQSFAIRPGTADGGVLRRLVLVIEHPPRGDAGRFLDKAGAEDLLRGPAVEPAPARLVNPELFRTLRRGARVWRQERQAAGKAIQPHPFSRTGNWIRLEVERTGVYEVAAGDMVLQGIPFSSVDPTKLRLFKGGGLPLDVDVTVPDSLQEDRVSLHEVAIAVRDDNGEWDQDDSLLFYACGGDAWLDRLDPGAEKLDRFEHRSAARGVYWLTWEFDTTPSPFPDPPLRIGGAAVPAQGLTPLSEQQVRVHFEASNAEATGIFADGWAWSTVVNPLPSLNVWPLDIGSVLPGRSSFFSLDLRSMMTRRVPDSYRNDALAWLNDAAADTASLQWTISQENTLERVILSGWSTGLVGGRNLLTLLNRNPTYYVSSEIKVPLRLALDCIDLLYWAPLSKASGQLEFAHWGDQVSMPGETVDLSLELQGALPAEVSVWDVSQATAPVALSGTAVTSPSAAIVLGLVRDPDTQRHFVAFAEADLRSPVLLRRVYSPQDLRTSLPAADYVVLHDPLFADAAAQLAALRSEHLPGITAPVALAVSEEAVYDCFSGGLKDPLALRNFLRWFYQRDGRLRYVCFMGDATRDPRNYLNHDPGSQLYDFLPTWVRTNFPDRLHEISWRNEPYACDDELVSFEAPPNPFSLDTPDLAAGRLPVRSGAEARDAVARIGDYTTAPAEGPWRNRVLMTADDTFSLAYGEGELDHTEEAERLSSQYVASSLDVLKVYLSEYPKPPESNLKPGARLDALTHLNDGVTIFHYVGHGSNNVLADEQLMRLNDIPSLRNGERRPLFLAFSCDVGVFDDIVSQSLAEIFVAQPQGGAIAAIGAAQASWGGLNDRFSEYFYANLFPGQLALISTSVGEALLLGKQDLGPFGGQWLENSQRYHLFGDPALHLPHPLSGLDFSAESVDTLHGGRLERVVVDLTGLGMVGGGALAYDLQVADARPWSSITNGYRTVYYWLPGATVFHGTGTVQGDRLEIPFKVPVQLAYGDSGRVRVLLGSADAEWADARLIPVVLTALPATDDLRGPQIQLAFADGRYRVQPGSLVEAAMSDTSGVSILGTLPSNSVLLEFDDSGLPINVSDRFVFDPGSYTSGRVSVPLPADLALGPHKAALFASDVLGNVGSDTLSFQIVAGATAGIADATIFPNPTSGPCRLVFELSDAMRVEWSIYTLAGHRIKLLREDYISAGPKIMAWDGRDQYGDGIANGVYLYVLRGRRADDREHEIKQTGRLVIMK